MCVCVASMERDTPHSHTRHGAYLPVLMQNEAVMLTQHTLDTHARPVYLFSPQKSAEQPHTHTHCPAHTEQTAQLRSSLRVWLFFISTAGESTGGVSYPSDLSAVLTLFCTAILYTLCHTHIILLFLFTLLLFFICSTPTLC